MIICKPATISAVTASSENATYPDDNLLDARPKIGWQAASSAVTSATLTSSLPAGVDSVVLLGAVADAASLAIDPPYTVPDLTITGSVVADTTNAPPIAGATGSALLDHTDTQRLSVTDASLPAEFPFKSGTSDQVMTFCGWVRGTDIVAAATSVIFAKDGIDIAITSAGELRFVLYQSPSPAAAVESAPLQWQDGRWYHVSIIYRETLGAIFGKDQVNLGMAVWDATADGWLLGPAAVAVPLSDDITIGTGVLSFGQWKAGTSFPFNGNLADFAIYGEALTVAQVEAIRDNGAANAPGVPWPMALWPMQPADITTGTSATGITATEYADAFGGTSAHWFGFGELPAAATATLTLTQTGSTVISATNLLAGKAATIDGVEYPLQESLVDTSIRAQLLDGSEYYKKRDIYRAFSGTLRADRAATVEPLLRAVCRTYGSVPMAVQIAPTVADAFMVYGRMGMAQASHAWPTVSQASFELVEVV